MTGAVTETLRLASGRWPIVLSKLGIALPSRRPGKAWLDHINCPFPAHNDHNPSWRWDDHRELYFCTCGSGSGLDAVLNMGAAHDPLSGAQFIRDALGEPPLGKRKPETPAQRAERERKTAEALAYAEKLRLEREAEQAEYAKQQGKKALRMWLRATGSTGTIVQHYLASRGITCELPETLRFLPPAEPGHHPAMIAPFGIPHEYAPGRVRMPPMWLKGAHLTLLRPDGSGKAVNRDGNSKITIGVGHNFPIVLAPANDLGGLVIAEGIEDALSAHQATGLGAWTAGTANRLPGLAQHVPDYIEAVTIQQDDDPAGRRYSEQLAEAVAVRGIDVFISQAGAHGS